MTSKAKKGSSRHHTPEAEQHAAPLFPGSTKVIPIKFKFEETERELSLAPVTPLHRVLKQVADVYNEEDELALVYSYGRGKQLVVKHDDEFQASCITWPGSPAISFKVELQSIIARDFNGLCLRRIKFVTDPERLRRLETSINGLFQTRGVSCIMSMKSAGDITAKYSIYHSLALIMKMRQLTHPILKRLGGNIVKFEGEKTFTVFEKPEDAVAACVLIMNVLEDYNSSVDESMFIEVSIGCDTGEILLIPHDLYGDCVNVSSKLGEDTAELGDLLITRDTYDRISGLSLFRPIEFEALEVERSGVVIPYYRVTGRLSDDYTASVLGMRAGESLSDEHEETTFSKLCRQRLMQDGDASADFVDQQIRERYEQMKVIFVSDMSGFTRTVKKRGILHFLSLIMYMRHTVIPILTAHGGTLVKTEADNLYFLFSDPDDAIKGVLKAMAVLQKYNDSKQSDEDKILVACGMEYGPVLYTADDHDIYGPYRNRAEELGENQAEPLEILITDTMKRALRGSYRFSEEQTCTGAGDEDLTFVRVKSLA